MHSRLFNLIKRDYTFFITLHIFQFYDGNGRQAFGVCCTNPITPSPLTDNEINHIDNGEPSASPNKNHYQSWPPPLPTHPPHHTPATHPAHFGVPGTTTKRPNQTTWPTRPVYGETTKAPQQWPPAVQTHPQGTTIKPSYKPSTDSSNEIQHHGTCGHKNGNLVC